MQDKSSTDNKLTHSLSTKEAVTGGLFWAKWGTLLCVGLLMSFLGSYQKTYGQGYSSIHLPTINLSITVQGGAGGLAVTLR